MIRTRKPDGTRDRTTELKAGSMHLDGVQPFAFVTGSRTPRTKIKAWRGMEYSGKLELKALKRARRAA